MNTPELETRHRLQPALQSYLPDLVYGANDGIVTTLVVIASVAGAALSSKVGQWMREAISKASLPLDCQPHGLRKAAGRRLAEAGCTAHEIMAVLGHKTLTEAERYTREADQARLAAAAFAKLEGRNADMDAQTDSDGLGATAKSGGKSE